MAQPPTPAPEDVRVMAQLTLQAASGEHTAQRLRQNMLLDHTWQAAQGVLKATFALNGAALVAVLALIGSVIQHGGPALPRTPTLATLSLFAAG